MRWLGYLCSVFLFSLGLFVGTCIINQNNVSAVSDISYTLSSSDSNHQFCYQSACDGFKYAIITSSDYFIGSSGTNVVFSFQAPLSSPQTYSSRSISSIFLSPYDSVILPLNFTSFNRITVSLDNSSSWGSVSVTVTLSDSIPSSCPICPTCPEVPENPYDDKLNDIKYAIFTIPATLLILYFFYCIYRMLLKGRI